MPFIQSGDAASASLHGTYNDVAGNQYITYNSPAVADSRLREIRQTLKLLEPADMDATHREECLDGTRTEITQLIFEWAQKRRSKMGHTMLLLRGVAGSGKSTIATTIANRFNTLGWLGAFIFFERDVAVRNDPSTVIRTMAYKLGVSHEKIGEAIAANVKKYPEIVHFPLRAQFQHLLVGPMTSEGVVDPACPIVFVLDAMDECGNTETRQVLLDLLAEQSNRLPALFAITTRPLQDISGFFEDRDHILVQDLDITTQRNNDDISTFLTHNMKRIRRKYPSIRRRNNWPANETFLQLVHRTSGLFIWASTACKFIDQHPVESRLKTIIDGTSASTADDTIDALYRTALEAAGSWDNSEFVSDFRAVLGLILVARRPLAADDIVSLLGDSVTEGCIDVISQLGCVLQLDPKARLLHPSFADFLYHPHRCGRSDWLFVESMLHQSVAQMCINLLDSVLKENLCDMILSPTFGPVEVSDNITYACIYWIDHVCMHSEPTTILPLLEHFMHRHLLHWVEAMSILKASRNTIGILERLYAWLRIQNGVADILLNLVNDGVRFVRRHADHIEDHPLLVYSSALAFTPIDTLIYKTFHHPLVQPVLLRTVETCWSPLLQVLIGHSHVVYSVAFSPDATQIVSTSHDKTVRVWDSNSGIEILPALKAHEDGVRSAAFSPDGARIVSGSCDATVRLWDASSGVEVLPPMRGHAGSVNCVAFSPDGKFIISGSSDMTIRVWDANSGVEVLRPLQGHTGVINTVACSQTRIASGSDDRTICVWDIASGLEALPSLRGHSSKVYSVVFSPDGSHIASGSFDDTIRLWDSTTGAQVLPAFRGHTRWVRSVAFSFDGTRIISGADDKTIRVWDVTTGNEVVSPLTYNNCCLSVSFSPDGTRFLSGSFDHSVQVWDATLASESMDDSVEEWDVPLIEGHTASVNSVAFSADGTRLVTGSNDDAILVWDPASGTQLVPPFKFRRQYSHLSGVFRVTFSPDGARIASGGRDGQIHIRDAISGLPTAEHPIMAHHATIYSVAFSSDGTCIASGSDDKTARVWDTTTGLEVLPSLHHNRPVTEVAFSTDGCQIISYDTDHQRYVWDAFSGTLISNEVHGDPMPPSGEILFDKDSGWITDRISKKYLSKFPSSSVEYCCHANHGRTLVIGTKSGNVCFMQF